MTRRTAIAAPIIGAGPTLFNQRRPDGAERFWRTVTSHGIARRALITALIVGTVLTAIMVVLAALDGGRAGPVPAVQIAQVYTLPLFFGAVSQALSYRRARARALFRPGGQAEGPETRRD